MKHPFNQQLFSYWTERRGARDAPEHDDIDPGAIRGILGDSFVLTYDAETGCSFRVAGTRLCALLGRELHGKPFASIWDAESAPEIRDLVGIVADEGIGAAAGVTAVADEDSHCNLELLLLPLADRGTVGMRMLGMLAPLKRPYWLGIRPARPLRLGVLQFVGHPSIASLATEIVAPPSNMRIRRTFTVIEGGRA
jgi:hypothetical protein